MNRRTRAEKLHAWLVILTASVLLVSGVAAATTIPDDLLAVGAAGLWGWTVGCGVMAYAQKAWRR